MCSCDFGDCEEMGDDGKVVYGERIIYSTYEKCERSTIYKSSI